VTTLRIKASSDSLS